MNNRAVIFHAHGLEEGQSGKGIDETRRPLFGCISRQKRHAGCGGQADILGVHLSRQSGNGFTHQGLRGVALPCGDNGAGPFITYGQGLANTRFHHAHAVF